jgi:hypothetical protein
MRAHEFITEGRTSSIQSDVASAIPGGYRIPSLPNQDVYKQYRFGVAMAAARSRKDGTEEVKEFKSESPWGESMIVVGYDDISEVVDQALDLVGLNSSDKKLLGTPTSEEALNVANISPVIPFKGYTR